ncbi:hypothetical protein AUJ14_01390 [Candidatus Micrarchaeota archaeon CG1_02_55_22]|nr:MAG: hypothetical protein AUJ14_01390 [Candidatus Micrarchaeota archaeon CG1_02_55_22]
MFCVTNRRDDNEDWFTGAHYQHGQPFRTLAGDHIVGQLLSRRVEALVGNPPKARALEVGPGEAPLLERTAIGGKYYLERSYAVARKLRGSTPGAAVLLGDIREIPVSRKPHFDVAVAAEVFTHVLPERRLDALKSIADRTKALLVIDRPTMSDHAIGEELRFHMMMLALERGSQNVAREILFKEIPADTMERERLERVDFEPLAQRLRERGFSVEIEPIMHRHFTYHVMTARRR